MTDRPTADRQADCWCVVHGPSDRCRTALRLEVERLTAENERLRRALHRETTLLRDMGRL